LRTSWLLRTGRIHIRSEFTWDRHIHSSGRHCGDPQWKDQDNRRKIHIKPPGTIVPHIFLNVRSWIYKVKVRTILIWSCQNRHLRICMCAKIHRKWYLVHYCESSESYTKTTFTIRLSTCLLNGFLIWESLIVSWIFWFYNICILWSLQKKINKSQIKSSRLLRLVKKHIMCIIVQNKPKFTRKHEKMCVFDSTYKSRANVRKGSKCTKNHMKWHITDVYWIDFFIRFSMCDLYNKINKSQISCTIFLRDLAELLLHFVTNNVMRGIV